MLFFLAGNNKTYGGEPQYYSILFSEDIFTALGPFHIHASRFHCSSYVDLFSNLIDINSCRRVFIIMLMLNLYQVKMYKLHVLMVFLCIHLCTKKWSFGADWLVAAGTYSCFCGMKRPGVFLLPPGRDASPSHVTHPQFVRFLPTVHQYPFIYLGGEKHCQWQQSVLPKNWTQRPQPGLDPAPQDPETTPMHTYLLHSN